MVLVSSRRGLRGTFAGRLATHLPLLELRFERCLELHNLRSAYSEVKRQADVATNRSSVACPRGSGTNKTTSTMQKWHSSRGRAGSDSAACIAARLPLEQVELLVQMRRIGFRRRDSRPRGLSSGCAGERCSCGICMSAPSNPSPRPLYDDSSVKRGRGRQSVVCSSPDAHACRCERARVQPRRASPGGWHATSLAIDAAHGRVGCCALRRVFRALLRGGHDSACGLRLRQCSRHSRRCQPAAVGIRRALRCHRRASRSRFLRGTGRAGPGAAHRRIGVGHESTLSMRPIAKRDRRRESPALLATSAGRRSQQTFLL
jgi:hypothetical protein